MFIAFKKFYNLNINENDKVVLLKILKLKLSVASVKQMELYTDTENCEAVNDALNPCIFFVLFCLLMNELMNLLMNLLVNLSPISFQIVIYEHFCVCMDIWWFTCMPLSFFLCSLVRLFLFCCLDTTCKHYYVIKLTQTFGIALLWKPDFFMFPECIKISRLITTILS